ncbi:MAG: D-arabinono-1,4-lactone oxidase [Micromonosporaceae bacterium]
MTARPRVPAARTGSTTTSVKGAATSLRPVWRNWARNQRTTARQVARPASRDELVAAVRGARVDGLTLKPVGNGHSFTPIAATDGVRLVLDTYDSVLAVDQDRMTVRVQAGISLHQLNAVLAEHGLGLSNLGDIDGQTISGAISTGTHGTGARFGGLATFVEELEIVTGLGEVIRCSEASEPEAFAAARVGLGALGVISEVTLRCERAFHLHCDERPVPLPTVLAEMDELAAANEHFEFWWLPHTDMTLTKRLNRLDESEQPRPLSTVRSWWEDSVLENSGMAAAGRVGRRVPRLVPQINRAISRMVSPRVYSDRSDRVFCSPRRVRFTELEHAVPRAQARRALTAIQDVITRLDVRTTMPVEVRFTAADDTWLSHSYGRDSVYLAVHQPIGMENEPYFRAVDEALADLGGRPHWGKLHYADVTTLAERYPKFSNFLAVRDRLDPERVFANSYLERVLGP